MASTLLANSSLKMNQSTNDFGAYLSAMTAEMAKIYLEKLAELQFRHGQHIVTDVVLAVPAAVETTVSAVVVLLPAPSHSAIMQLIRDHGVPYLGGKSIGVAFSDRKMARQMVQELQAQGLVENKTVGRGQPTWALTAAGYKTF